MGRHGSGRRRLEDPAHSFGRGPYRRLQDLTRHRRLLGSHRHPTSRHVIISGAARPREAESLTIQIRRELTLRGVPGGEHVQAEEIADATWVAVHVPRREALGQTYLGDRRGYWLRLTFPTPVTGPLRLGHSSSFGLGLFKPVT